LAKSVSLKFETDIVVDLFIAKESEVEVWFCANISAKNRFCHFFVLFESYRNATDHSQSYIAWSNILVEWLPNGESYFPTNIVMIGQSITIKVLSTYCVKSLWIKSFFI
jgi:hypothetical protein